MSIFITGATGYLGSYVVANLLRDSDERLALLVRADSPARARQRLWQALQLHMEFAEFEAGLPRLDVYLGDITQPELGQAPRSFERLVERTQSIIHIAASLNRKSSRVCFDVNLRGALEVIKLARAAHDAHGLRRFSEVSTTAVAGTRSAEVVHEDSAIDWQRSDYDPYARTKKFAEHMLHRLLADVPRAVFRPSIVLGDSRFPQTTQFDMVRAFVMLARLPVLPFRPDWRLDIVPADYVARAIATLHQRPALEHACYHLSAGQQSLTYAQIVRSLRLHGRALRHVFAPGLGGAFDRLVTGCANTPRNWGLSRPASLLKVFLPYLCFDTVFDNTRVVQALGHSPRPFDEYASGLLTFALDSGMRYPYKPWPAAHAEPAQSVYA